MKVYCDVDLHLRTNALCLLSGMHGLLHKKQFRLVSSTHAQGLYAVYP